MKTVYMFNGPPRIGKDVLAEELRYALRIPSKDKHTLASEVIRLASEWYKLPEIIDRWNTPDFKDTYHPVLMQTPRNAVIDYSKKHIENKPFNSICKPVYDRISGSSIITDIGYQREYDTFKCLKEEGYQIIVIQLHHPSFNFSKDSRKYVEVDAEDLLTFNVTRGDIRGDSEKLIKALLDRKYENCL